MTVQRCGTYYDARLVAERKCELRTSTGPFLVGNGFRGVVVRVAIFDRALSPAEIRKLYQMGETASFLPFSIDSS